MPIISLMDMKKFTDGKKEVTSPNILTTNGKFDVNGLFSEVIFGLDNSKDRSKTFSYIHLHTKILHPFMYEVFKKIEEKIIHLIEGNILYYNTQLKVLSKEQDKSNSLMEVSGFDGAMYVINHGLSYRGDTDVRFKLIDKLQENIDKGLAFIENVVVIPPSSRPIVLNETGEVKSMDDLNTLYIQLINESKKIQLIGKSNDDTGQMSDNALIRKKIQDIVNEIYLVGKTKPAKKFGLNRGQLLGKRVDFSARSSVTSGYDIPAGSLGVPYRIIANIAQPLLIYHLSSNIVDSSHDNTILMNILERNDFDKSKNVLVLTNLLKDISENKCKLSKEEEQWVMKQFQIGLGEYMVLVKRDPSIHKGSWQSMNPIVCDGASLRFPPMQAGFLNLDFDGDSFDGKVRLRVTY